MAGPRALRPRTPPQARARPREGVTHTRAGVIKRVEAEYRALDAVVRKLAPAGLRKPAMRDEAPIRFTAKDVLAHINAWKWRQGPGTAKDKPPERPDEPPRLRKIAPINAAIYAPSPPTPARPLVAPHRGAHRARLQALRDAPPA